MSRLISTRIPSPAELILDLQRRRLLSSRSSEHVRYSDPYGFQCHHHIISIARLEPSANGLWVDVFALGHHQDFKNSPQIHFDVAIPVFLTPVS